MSRKKKREGISLIALLITIVVLIILAGVSISAIKNNNGIINQTSHAQEKKNASEEKEAIEWAAAQMVGNANNLTGQIADKQTEEEITNEKNDFEAQIKKYIGTKAETGNDFEFQIYAPGSVYLTQSNQEMTVTSDLYIVKFIKSGNIYTVDGNGNVHYQEEQSAISTEDRDGVRISPAEISINNGTTQELSIITNAQIANVKISSSDENIIELVRENNNVKVENGKFYVIAKKLGKAKVTVELTNGKKAVTYIYVHQEPTAVKLQTEQEIIDLSSVITSVQLTATIEPITANYKTGLTWSSNNESVAVVDENGLVVAQSNGTAVITVETENGKKATCTVIVQTTPISLTLNKESIILDTSTNSTEQLIASIFPASSNVNNGLIWSAEQKDGKDIVTVEGGFVTAKSNGETIVTATTTNGKTATCKVKVQTTPKTITLNHTEATIDLSGTKTLELKATISPSTANINTGVSWKSSNPEVAKVSSTGVITGVANGTTTITATTGNGKTTTCKITVVTTPTSVTLNKTGAKIDLSASVKTIQLSATINPKTANTQNGLTWTSSNTKVATVNSSGVVTGVANGTTTITVKTTNGKVATCSITVYTSITKLSITVPNSKMEVGTQMQLKANITPTTTTEGIVWVSSNTNVATIDQNGLVTGKSNGKTIITLKSASGAVSVTTEITVQTSPNGVTLNKSEVSLNLSGTKTVQLSASVTPATANANLGLTWTSSNPNVATVSTSGLVTGVANGTTTITVKTQTNKTATCKVVVQTSPVSVSLNVTSITLDMNGTRAYQLRATINPNSANINTGLSWKSANTGIATVDGNGYVTAISNGTTTITVTTGNGKTATCKVTVQTSPSGVWINQTSVVLDLSHTSSTTLYASAQPSSSNVNNQLTWSSSNSGIVSVDGNGKITGKSNGTATITARTANGKTATCTVTVCTSITSISINPAYIDFSSVGQTSQISVTKNPSTTTESLVWTSSNNNVATVNSSGLVTAKGAGTATITVKSSSSHISANCTVAVTLSQNYSNSFSSSNTVNAGWYTIGKEEWFGSSRYIVSITGSMSVGENSMWSDKSFSLALEGYNGSQWETILDGGTSEYFTWNFWKNRRYDKSFTIYPNKSYTAIRARFNFSDKGDSGWANYNLTMKYR